jgi:hypothetical protein
MIDKYSTIELRPQSLTSVSFLPSLPSFFPFEVLGIKPRALVYVKQILPFSYTPSSLIKAQIMLTSLE